MTGKSGGFLNSDLYSAILPGQGTGAVSHAWYLHEKMKVTEGANRWGKYMRRKRAGRHNDTGDLPLSLTYLSVEGRRSTTMEMALTATAATTSAWRLLDTSILTPSHGLALHFALHPQPRCPKTRPSLTLPRRDCLLPACRYERGQECGQNEPYSISPPVP